MEPDQSGPSEKPSKRTLTGPSVTLEEAQSGTTILGRNQRLKYTSVIR
jgi:hypothetical protein